MLVIKVEIIGMSQQPVSGRLEFIFQGIVGIMNCEKKTPTRTRDVFLFEADKENIVDSNRIIIVLLQSYEKI